jgi:apolipoprotein D and lipocalin family protein
MSFHTFQERGGDVKTARLKLTVLLCGLLALGCVRLPERITPVKPFEVGRYLGQWYEIARLDHSFERGLTQVSATYSLREDGGLAVLNRGWSAKDGAWKTATGKAYFVRDPKEGYLKVSFFGPFYGSYVIFHLDQKDYRYALVAGPDKSYLWLLARTPTLDAALQRRLIAEAAALGFDTSRLILVEQGPTGTSPLTPRSAGR